MLERSFMYGRRPSFVGIWKNYTLDIGRFYCKHLHTYSIEAHAFIKSCAIFLLFSQMMRCKICMNRKYVLTDGKFIQNTDTLAWPHLSGPPRCSFDSCIFIMWGCINVSIIYIYFCLFICICIFGRSAKRILTYRFLRNRSLDLLLCTIRACFWYGECMRKGCYRIHWHAVRNCLCLGRRE